eukprot:TRINITY_DN41223_c0_g1_i2.p2 TRINITY_DN41223_c0_g1~~TRINITY_DN41223_c0_g1_i2.p2  ORF type:complete len:246 (-),score=27.65 TRINITY_DN41223_c0_g1_i2:224-961(-)
MKIKILTLFPEMFEGVMGSSIMKRAIERDLLKVDIINIRDYAQDKHKTADDYPFGGGAGMVLKPEPLFKALHECAGKIIYTSPQGRTLDQEFVKELSQEEEITIIAGHYEGIDERVIQKHVDYEVSVGDYVLTGDELPAMIIVDAVSRMVPGVIKEDSFVEDSFYNGLLDYPHYTRPSEFEGLKVPEILLSGHHENIRIWRLKQSLKNTYTKRPDLLKKTTINKRGTKTIERDKARNLQAKRRDR